MKALTFQEIILCLQRYWAERGCLLVQPYYQFQVIMKPAPADVQSQYLDSLAALGLKVADHDVRFVQDDWESPSLGAWGLGWEVRLDGVEVTQFTYFQEIGGV